MSTREYFRRYGYLYLYVFAAFLLTGALVRGSAEAVFARQELAQSTVIVIDPGHGGPDGGAVAADGTTESSINLQLARSLERLLALLGYDTAMIRTDDTDVATQGESLRQRKNSDLRNRVSTVNALSNALLISIHQNHFTQSQYSGPQVFSARDSASRALAQAVQQNLNLVTGSRREWKTAENVYLMEHIQCPGILVECGFLSNAAEAALLKTAAHQQKLVCAIAAAVVGYLESGGYGA